MADPGNFASLNSANAKFLARGIKSSNASTSFGSVSIMSAAVSSVPSHRPRPYSSGSSVTSTITATEDDVMRMPVGQKCEWFENVFKRHSCDSASAVPDFLDQPGHELVQLRHRWIEEELLLRKTLRQEGFSDKVINHELVSARKKWFEEQSAIRATSPLLKERDSDSSPTARRYSTATTSFASHPAADDRRDDVVNKIDETEIDAPDDTIHDTGSDQAQFGGSSL
jgi:hypothetical protein